ncbi:hypothetical protein [Nonomuraea sp. bgisy101]|uniref:hypothetical protein n=1 Tax=Nonomuraea sp. bgisy101 TaxID=3413784 RepID=UPI003D75493B
MYRQSLPPTTESPAAAALWAREIALHERPELADNAEKAMRELVSQAVRRTGADQLMHAEIMITPRGMSLTVKDPGRPDHTGGPEWAEMSTLTSTLLTRSGPDGHEACVELHPSLAETA